MSSTYIPAELRERVSEEAGRRCGYCLTSEAVVGSPMEIDHLVPRSLGGLTVEENLWLACSLCNDHKKDRIAGIDPLSGELVRLFDPRREKWIEHFRWSDSLDRIIGLTATGRATVIVLNMNRPTLVRARQLWVSVGWHPPSEPD